MRNRWLVVVVIASLCLNVAVVGAYFLRRVRHDHPRRFPLRGLTAEVREKMRKAREAAMPEFSALVARVDSTDSLLWAEMRSEGPDSARVDSFCQELGRVHGRMRAMVFWQMRRELQMMPAAARAEYLNHMMTMRPGLGRPGQVMGRHMRRGAKMPPPREDEPPPPESGN